MSTHLEMLCDRLRKDTVFMTLFQLSQRCSFNLGFINKVYYVQDKASRAVLSEPKDVGSSWKNQVFVKKDVASYLGNIVHLKALY